MFFTPCSPPAQRGRMRCCCPCGAPSDEDDVYRRHVDPAEPTADPVVAAVPSVAVGEDDFESLRVLGRGTYGKVVQARKRGTGQLYALKIMRKEDVLSRNQVRHTLTERHVLQSVRHPFVIGLQFAFHLSLIHSSQFGTLRVSIRDPWDLFGPRVEAQPEILAVALDLGCAG